MTHQAERLIRASIADAVLRVGFLVLAKSKGEAVSYRDVREVIADMVAMNPEMATRLLTGLLVIDINRDNKTPIQHEVSKN